MQTCVGIGMPDGSSWSLCEMDGRDPRRSKGVFVHRAVNIQVRFTDRHVRTDELKTVVEGLRGHDDKIRIVLNKADQVFSPSPSFLPCGPVSIDLRSCLLALMRQSPPFACCFAFQALIASPLETSSSGQYNFTVICW